MPLQDLLNALEEEGTAAHEKAQQDRRRQAAQIMSEAQEQADRAREETLAAAEAAALQEAHGILTAARAGARRASRTARDGALEKVRALAAERLLELPGSPEGQPRCTCLCGRGAGRPAARHDRSRAPGRCRHAAVRLSVDVIADLTAGGATAEDGAGRYVDNTYLTRLANIWPDTRVRLSRAWDQP